MLDLLKTHFGFDRFLPLQEEIINSVMGGKDTFVLMPTGGGKSLCYQLPALALDGLTLVVSPLIALMKDQVDSLRANGVPAGFINSTLTASQTSRVQEMVRRGEIKILYVAPERVTLPEFRAFLAQSNVGLVAIDEAHCVSHWGHEFRPAYRELKALRDVCPGAPAIALTATATKMVRDDILSQLGLREPEVFTSSFDRGNLTYSVEPKAQSFPRLLELLDRRRNESVIIYCLSRKATEEMAENLSRRGLGAAAYHAGLEPNARRDIQDRFIRDQVPIVAATIAFGMGIDKPDIRLVVHYDMPKSIEGYYQETGRAGRDGLPSECVLFYTHGDRVKQEFFINQLEDPEEKKRARERLERMLQFCNLTTCRRKYLLEYLGEDRTERHCGGCDVCLTPRESYDATEIAQMTLSAVVRTGQRFGAKHVIDVLMGSTTKQVEAWSHQELPLFGVARQRSASEFQVLVPELVAQGLLERSDGQYATLSVSEKGWAFLKNRESLTLTRPIPKTETKPAGRDSDGNYDSDLFAELAALRKRLADDRAVPAYIIFGNRSLEDMARKAPRTREEFSRVSGVGSAKLREFGDTFIDAISQYVETQGLPLFYDPVDTLAGRGSRSSVSDSARVTGQIVSGGSSVEETARQRGVKPRSVINHLERLVNEGISVQIGHLMPEDERLKRIMDVFEATGQLSLKPTMETLGDGCTYDELRIVRLELFRRRRAAGQG